MPTDIAADTSAARVAAPPPPALSGPAAHRTRRRRPLEAFEGVSVVVVSLFAALCIAPFWLVIASSFTSEEELVSRGYSFWPESFSLEAYEAIFSGHSVLDAYLASLFITTVGTVLALVTTSALAYAIASNMRGLSRPLAVMTYIPMLFSGGLVPFYILVTQYLQLSNSLWAVILPGLVSPFLTFVMVSFFRSLPVDVIEAARIDGASELRILFQIVVPMSKPILATIGLFYALAYWSEWFNAPALHQRQRQLPAPTYAAEPHLQRRLGPSDPDICRRQRADLRHAQRARGDHDRPGHLLVPVRPAIFRQGTHPWRHQVTSQHVMRKEPSDGNDHLGR